MATASKLKALFTVLFLSIALIGKTQVLGFSYLSNSNTGIKSTEGFMNSVVMAQHGDQIFFVLKKPDSSNNKEVKIYCYDLTKKKAETITITSHSYQT